ncbi:MAG: GNAT family N-acetyltransferase [Devosia sp.]
MTLLDAALPGADIAARPASAALSGTAEAITTRAGLEAIAAEWAALEHRAPGATWFQSLAWARAVFDFEQQRANPAFAPVIATWRERGQLKAVLPLERTDGRFRKALMPLGGAFPQYADLLADPGIDAGKALMAMLKAAATARPADLAALLKVRAGCRLLDGIPRSAIRTGARMGAPYVDCAVHPDFDSYFKLLKQKTRKNMRNARNRLEREAPLTHSVAASPDAIRGVIGRTVAGRAGRLRDQGLTSRAFTDPAFADFCAGLAGRDGIDILAMSLDHGDQAVAEQWGFVHRGRYYAFVASRDFEQSDESPGKLHLKEIIETCFARSIHTADLLVPVMPYKLTWASGVTEVADFAVPLTLKGRLGIALWDQRLRPLAKYLVMAMPKSLRGALMKLAGRG